MEVINSLETTMPYFIPICVFIFGAMWGSFLNVCIYRIPEGHSIVRPPSTCRCGQQIPFYFNLPIIAWFLLKGKAACCDEKLSFRYPLVEALTGILFLCSWLSYSPVVAFVGMIFIAILIAATFIDLDHMIIPDIFSIGGMILGVIVSIFVPELHGFSQGGIEAHWYSWIEAMLGVFIGTSMIYWIATIGEIILKKPAMGEGDVKFLAAIGAFTGWQGALLCAFWWSLYRYDYHFALFADAATDEAERAQASRAPIWPLSRPWCSRLLPLAQQFCRYLFRSNRRYFRALECA
jgi:leader peptidase (prepilin peptidase)/N-methyltransferase